MILDRLDVAEAEARRFMARVKALRIAVKSGDVGSSCRIVHGREAAAVARASLDLSMALAVLRRSDYDADS